MIDLFEIIFIWGLYVILPTLLIIHFLGRERAVLLLSGLLFLSQTDDMSYKMFPTEMKDYVPMEQIRDSDKSGSFINPFFGFGNSGPKTPNSKPKSDKPLTAAKPKADPAPRFNAPNGGSGSGSGSGNGSGNLPDVDKNAIPPAEAWQYDPEYWTDYTYEPGQWVKKSDKKDQEEEVCKIDQEQNKGGIEELPDSCSGKYIFDISTKSAREALARVWKNPETRKEVLASLQKLDDGTLLPRNSKNFKGFKGLQENKFTDTRFLYEPGKDGKPNKIVAIFLRKDMDDIKKALRPFYKKK